MTEDTAVRPEQPRTPRFGLSAKLLVLTILFVMIAEVLIYVPSVANFRVVWLRDRLATAYTAASRRCGSTGEPVICTCRKA